MATETRKATKTTRTVIVGEVCLYGTSRTGAGWLAVNRATGAMLGTGEPVQGRSFTEAIWSAVAALGLQSANRADWITVIRIFDSGGERCADIPVGATVPAYGAITWKPAPVFVAVSTLTTQPIAVGVPTPMEVR